MGNPMRTDNSYLATKLALRRAYLLRYHRGRTGQARHVADLFAGQRRLWSILRQETRLDSYLAVDRAGIAGALKMAGERYLSCPGWQHTIVDLDAYGQPWAAYQALLRTGREPVTVFLTVGFVAPHGSPLSVMEAEALGLRFRGIALPNGLTPAVHGQAVLACIHQADRAGWRILALSEGLPSQHARYFAVRLERV